MEKKSILSRIGNIYNNLEEYLLVVSLVINVLLVFLQAYQSYPDLFFP